MTVTPDADTGRVSGAVNPWRMLRERPDLVLETGWLKKCSAMIVDNGTFKTIVLHAGLNRVERNSALAHELAHERLGLLWCPGTPAHFIDVGERRVRSLTAEWLVPARSLASYVGRQLGMSEGVTAAMVAGEFDVTEDVARDALNQFEYSIRRTA